MGELTTTGRLGNLKYKDLFTGILLAGAYFLSGKFGLQLASVNPSASAVWAPTGIALAAFLCLGYRVWPGIATGAFLVNVTTTGALIPSLAIASGNTLEGILGCYLVRRYAQGTAAFEQAHSVFWFTLLAAGTSSAVSATIGATSLALSGLAEWQSFLAVWTTWWLGDAVGALVVAPPIILWRNQPHIKLRYTRLLEAAAMLLYLFLASKIIFGTVSLTSYSLEFLCIPFLVWAAVRFGPREAATAMLLLSVVAIWDTLQGSGPFVRGSRHESLMLLQVFSAVMAVMTLTLAAVVVERRRAEEKVRHLATTDALTGLSNYRRLVEALNAEVERCDRTGRHFSVILLDLDGLKRINDTFGHLTGSRALCRVADVLRLHSRVMDTAARYGGDEFALVLPETSADAAGQAARRIQERLAADREEPTLGISVGVAEYPRDGESFRDLFRAADDALYQMKSKLYQK